MIAFSSGRGGRYERYFALLCLASAFPFAMATMALEDIPEAMAVAGVDLVGLVVTAWLLSRRREAWLMVQTTIAAVCVPVDLVFHVWHVPGVKPEAGLVALWWIQGGLAYLSLAVLVWAVLRREFGPPYPLPRRAAQSA